jgi:hypothetical protein
LLISNVILNDYRWGQLSLLISNVILNDYRWGQLS